MHLNGNKPIPLKDFPQPSNYTCLQHYSVTKVNISTLVSIIAHPSQQNMPKAEGKKKNSCRK